MLEIAFVGLRIILLLLFVVTRVGASADALTEGTRFESLTRGWSAFHLTPINGGSQSGDLEAWLNGLPEEGFVALKDFLNSGTDRGGLGFRLTFSYENALSCQELLLAHDSCKEVIFLDVFFPYLKNARPDFVIPAAQIFRRFEQETLEREQFIPFMGFLDAHHARHISEGKALLDQLRHHPPERLKVVAEADLSIEWLRALLHAPELDDAQNLPLLLTFFKDRSRRSGAVSVPREGLEPTLSAVLRTPPPLAEGVLSLSLKPDVRLKLLKKLSGFRVREAELAVTLLKEEPGRNHENLLSNISRAALDETSLKAIETQPAQTRRLHFVVSGTRLSEDDLGVVGELFDGCTWAEEKCIEGTLNGLCEPMLIVRSLVSYGLSPTGRASILERRSAGTPSLFENILHHFEGDARDEVMDLYRRLILGGTHEDIQCLSLYFDLVEPETRAVLLPHAKAILTHEFPPAVRALMISWPPPLESLPTFKELFEGMDLSDVAKTLKGIAQHHASIQDIALVHHAQFEPSLISIVMEKVEGLRQLGWMTPGALANVKWALDGDYKRWRPFNSPLLFKSRLNAQDLAAVCALMPPPDFLMHILKVGPCLADSALLSHICALMAGEPLAAQKIIFDEVCCASSQHEDTLKWLLPGMKNLSFSHEAQVVLLRSLHEDCKNHLTLNHLKAFQKILGDMRQEARAIFHDIRWFGLRLPQLQALTSYGVAECLETALPGAPMSFHDTRSETAPPSL